jgi:hypothetical protein
MRCIVAAVFVLGLVEGLCPVAWSQETVAHSVPIPQFHANFSEAKIYGDRIGSMLLAQRCPIPQCAAPDRVVCNVRRKPDGCVVWDCCPRR